MNFGVNDTSSPVALHHEGCLLVYLQIFLLKKTANASVRTMCAYVRVCLHLQGHKVCDSCLNQNRSSSWESEAEKVRVDSEAFSIYFFAPQADKQSYQSQEVL